MLDLDTYKAMLLLLIESHRTHCEWLEQVRELVSRIQADALLVGGVDVSSSLSLLLPSSSSSGIEAAASDSVVEATDEERMWEIPPDVLSLHLPPQALYPTLEAHGEEVGDREQQCAKGVQQPVTALPRQRLGQGDGFHKADEGQQQGRGDQ